MLVSYFYLTVYTGRVHTYTRAMLSLVIVMYVFTESKIRVLIEVVLSLIAYICFIGAVEDRIVLF